MNKDTVQKYLDMSDDEMVARCDEWLTHEEYVEGDGTDDEAGEEEVEEGAEEADGAEEVDEDEDAQEDGGGEENYQG